ncbi:hypothetical protein FRB91_010747 [Serendipita sp. 411]|nr:hypothetical protein FRB91_010747 [Serendipita sp. 411]
MRPSLVLWILISIKAEQCVAQFINATSFFFPAGLSSELLVEAGKWSPANSTNPYRTGPMELRSTTKGQILLSFRAFRFSLRISRPPGSSILVWMDGKQSPFPFIPESEAIIPIPASFTGLTTQIDDMSAMEGNITLGDHQLLVDISASGAVPVVFDRVEIVVDAPPSRPDSYTSLASSLPAGATADDVSPLIEYSNSGWQHELNGLFWNNTVVTTSTPGAWAQITFVGTGIWLYGAISVEGFVFSVETIKKYGEEVARNATVYNVTRPDLDIPIYQAPLFTQPNLPYANAYTYKFTLLSGKLQLDFFRVLGSIVPSNFESIETTTASHPSDSNANKIVIPIITTIFGAVLLGILCFLSGRRQFRKRRSGQSLSSQNEKKTMTLAVEPFYASNYPSSSSHSRSAKSAHAYSDASSASAPPPLPPPSTSYWDRSALTGSSTSTSRISNPTANVITLLDSDGGRRNDNGHDGDRRSGEENLAMSLSHSDLARVFRRAEELRMGNGGSGGARESAGAVLETNGELEPPLEALACQLANMDPNSSI